MANDQNNDYLRAIARRRLRTYSTHLFHATVAQMRAEACARIAVTARREEMIAYLTAKSAEWEIKNPDWAAATHEQICRQYYAAGGK